MLIHRVAGGEVSMALGGGTVKAGMAEMSPSSGNGLSTWGVTYSTTMGGASVAVGYTNGSSGSSKSTRSELSISQSIGAGASVFLDLSNASGSGTTTAGTNVLKQHLLNQLEKYTNQSSNLKSLVFFCLYQ